MMRRLSQCFSAALVLLFCGLSAGQPGQSPEIDRFSLQHSGAVDPMGATFAVTFSRAVAATYLSELGSQTLSVYGMPVKVSDGTWPAGIAGSQGYGWAFNGSTDYLSITDAASGGAFDPAGSFSVMAYVVPSTVAAGYGAIVAKYETTGGQVGWSLYRDTTSIWVTVSGDGATTLSMTKASALAANRPACVVFTLTAGGANGTGRIYVDELSVATSAILPATIFNNTANFEIGAIDTGGSKFSGRIDHVEFANGVAWTEAEVRARCRQYRGLLSAAGTPVSPTSASPPAVMVAPPGSGTEPFLVSQAPNTTQVGSYATGQGGLVGPSALANLAQRGSLESWAAGAPTGWTEGITSTGDCAQGTSRVAHGASAARCTLADADDAVTLTGACLTLTGATLYELSAWARLESGTGLLDLDLIEDDSADCGTPTTTTSVVNDAVPTGDWAKQLGTITTQAATIRAQVRVSLPAAAAQVLDIDAIQLRAVGANPAISHFCPGDIDATASCSAILLPNQSALLNHANGETLISFVASSPWAGTSLTADAYLLMDGLGANAAQISVTTGTDEPRMLIYDASVASRYITPNVLNWAANTDYTIKAWFDGAGGLGLRWNATDFTTPTGAGTGMRSAGQATTYLCGTNTVSNDCWIRNLCYCRTIDCVCDWSAP